jgi:hypothetical protein
MMMGSPVVLANRFFINVRFMPCPRAVPARASFIKLRRDVFFRGIVVFRGDLVIV